MEIITFASFTCMSHLFAPKDYYAIKKNFVIAILFFKYYI